MRALADRARRSGNAPFILGFAALVVLAKLPTLHSPAYWDEMGWLKQARWLSTVNLLRVLPGLHPPAAFWGHPPGLQLAAAALFKAFGPSRAVAHLLIAGFAAIGVCSTFLLARRLYGTGTACLAALLLLLSPQVFAQSGFFLGDLPVMALGVLSVHLALRGRYGAYLLVASYMVLLKETASALLIALIAYRFLCSTRPMKERLADACRYGVPLSAIGAYVVLQRITTGKFFYIYDFDIDPMMVSSPEKILHQFRLITSWLFVEQYRWIFSVAILVDLAVTPQTRQRREVWLFGLLVVLSAYPFSAIYYAPRYLLPAMPFIYVAGAGSLMELAGSFPMRTLVALGVTAVMSWSMAHQAPLGSGENAMTYLPIVRMHAAMAENVAAKFPNARILTTWPAGTELEDPFYGYVTRPLHVVWYKSDADLAESDVVLTSSPGQDLTTRLESLARERQWRLVTRMREGEFETSLYAPPDAPSPTAARAD